MNFFGIACCVGFFVAMGLGILAAQWVDARRSGWAGLGRRYRIGRRDGGRLFAVATVRVNRRWYVERVDVTLSARGILLQLRVPVRPFHRPVLVPWDDVEYVGLSARAELIVRLGDQSEATFTGLAAAELVRFLRRAPTRYDF